MDGIRGLIYLLNQNGMALAGTEARIAELEAENASLREQLINHDPKETQ